jgi:hypothetical protein
MVLAACWTSEVKTVQPKPAEPRDGELRAIVRIDAEPGGKKFQGVWLEFSDDKRFVIDYRANGLWKPFEDREVIVTGHCWAPDPRAQAISSTHFHVATMRMVKPERGHGPILEIGPELALRGEFRQQSFPAGSKLAGSSEIRFTVDGGFDYGIQGANVQPTTMNTQVLAIARSVEPDLTYTAQTGGPQLWIVDVREPDAEHDERTKTPCP